MQKIFVVLLIGVILLGVGIMNQEKGIEKKEYNNKDVKIATFSGGCFWCSESAFQEQGGVYEVISGYIGESVLPGQEPTYELVSSGKTQFREGVQVYYNPKEISYEKLLEIFWTHINPTQADGQFNDKGFHYTTAIFYNNNEEKSLAEESKERLQENYNENITTEILEFEAFYEAEEYHQDYYLKQSGHYELYNIGSGRKGFIEKNKDEIQAALKEKDEYIKPSDEELKNRLTDYQYYITQKDGTESPFENEYWDNKEPGIYVDVVTGEPLFSSNDKFDSGSGWPSFTKPIYEESIIKTPDFKLGVERTEISSKSGDTHLGHVFNDGPVDQGGQRYCVNSASLRFIHKNDLEKEGYGEYLELFN